MRKFCKIFENDEGDQLLIRLSHDEKREDLINVVISFRMESALVEVTLGDISEDTAEELLEKYDREEALKILKDPVAFVNSIIGVN